MIVKTATQARKELLSLIEKVNEDRAPIHITSRRSDVVLVSVDDYEAWQERFWSAMSAVVPDQAYLDEFKAWDQLALGFIPPRGLVKQSL